MSHRKRSLNEDIQETKRNIRIIGSSNNVVCWATRSYEATADFIEQVWGDSKCPYLLYENAAFWNRFALKAFPKNKYLYQQFWFFKKVSGVDYPEADLSDAKALAAFSEIKDTGDLLIGMNDSMNDFIDNKDRAVYSISDLENSEDVNDILRNHFEFGQVNTVNSINSIVYSDRYKYTGYLINYNEQTSDEDGDEIDIGSLRRIFVKGEVPAKFRRSELLDFDAKNLPKKLSYMDIIIENDKGLETFMTAAKNVTDVIGDITIKNLKSTKSISDLRIKNVKGNVSITNCESLESLKGCPSYVYGDFDCTGCSALKSLNGAPRVVAGEFECSYCTSLLSLDGLPLDIDKDFYCIGCTSLTDKTIPSKTEIGGKAIFKIGD